MLTGYQIATLVAFLGTLAAVVALAALGFHNIAEVAGVAGTLLTSILPSLSPKVSQAAAKASLRPPALSVHDYDLRVVQWHDPATGKTMVGTDHAADACNVPPSARKELK